MQKDIKTVKERYQRNVNSAIMADFYWSPQRNTRKDHHRKRKCARHFKFLLTKFATAQKLNRHLADMIFIINGMDENIFALCSYSLKWNVFYLPVGAMRL